MNRGKHNLLADLDLSHQKLDLRQEKHQARYPSKKNTTEMLTIRFPPRILVGFNLFGGHKQASFKIMLTTKLS